jgi:hypothetical protein
MIRLIVGIFLEIYLDCGPQKYLGQQYAGAHRKSIIFKRLLGPDTPQTLPKNYVSFVAQ